MLHHNYHICLDSEGLLRLRNYLPKNPQMQDIALPILMEPNSYLTKLILLNTHIKSCPAASQCTITAFKRHYFEPKASKLLPRLLREASGNVKMRKLILSYNPQRLICQTTDYFHMTIPSLTLGQMCSNFSKYSTNMRTNWKMANTYHLRRHTRNGH